MNGQKKNLTPDIVLKIKQLEIFTRRLLNGSLVGDSRSAIKGTGFEFDQIREYSCGDDIRFVDWKASARNNKLLIKQYREERSRVIILAVDVSQSTMFGSSVHTKQNRIAEIASVLALVAQHGKDHVALLLFSDHVSEYIPPGTSLYHVHRIMERLLTFDVQKSKTDISHALNYLLSVKKGNAIVFLISDFIDDGLRTYLPHAARVYDLIAVRCLDAHEKTLPSVGFVMAEDLETGELVEIDIRKRHGHDIMRYLSDRLAEQDKLFRTSGVEVIDVSLERADYLVDMVRFFRRRMMY